jgi:hypothetical protein
MAGDSATAAPVAVGMPVITAISPKPTVAAMTHRE